MAVISTGYELGHPLPAQDVFQIMMKFHELAPKAAPDFYKSITIEGEIGVGAIQTTKYADAVHLTYSKQRFESFDMANFSVTFTTFEGETLEDTLESVTHRLKVSTSGDGGSVFKHSIDLKCKGDAKLTEEFVKEFVTRTAEGVESVFKGLEALSTNSS